MLAAAGNIALMDTIDILSDIFNHSVRIMEMSRKLRPGIKDEDIMPATLAPELLTDLLRGEMAFNGVTPTLAASRPATYPIS